jgi:hypothetical protein
MTIREVTPSSTASPAVRRSRSGAAAQRVRADGGFDRDKARRAVENIIKRSKRVTLGPSLRIEDLIDEGRR